MDCTIYNRFMYNLMMGLIDLSSGTVKCALVTNAYTPDADHNVWATVSINEVSGIGYTANGKDLANKSIEQDDDNDKAVFDADDVVWADSTITAKYAVLYADDLDDNDLICVFDFGTDQSSDESSFFIIWNTDGIFSIAVKEE